jgi:hypothetical protein
MLLLLLLEEKYGQLMQLYHKSNYSVYMHLYTQDFVRRVGLSSQGCRRFYEGDQATAH